MTQYNFGTIDPYVVDGVQLAGMLNQWRDAMHSWHRGAAPPAYVVPGMMWIDDSAGATSWVVRVNMSAGVNPAMFTYNTTTGAITLNAAAGGTFVAAVLAASANATPMVTWNATGNPIDAKRWQSSVNAAGALVLSSLTDAGVVQQSITFNRNGTISTTGTTTAAFNVRATTADTLNGPNNIAVFRTPSTPVKDYDPDNVWDLANNRFTAPSAGRYQFSVHTYLTANAAGQCLLALRHMTGAGATIRDYAEGHIVDATGYGANFHLAMELQMAAGERVAFWIGGNPGVIQFLAVGGNVGGITGSALTFASGHRIGT